MPFLPVSEARPYEAVARRPKIDGYQAPERMLEKLMRSLFLMTPLLVPMIMKYPSLNSLPDRYAVNISP